MYSIRTEGSRFVDQHGRHIILHGISMVCKDKDKNYIDDWTFRDFEKLQQWGFNVIRLGIIWDGIEPEPGQYDDQYLEKIRKWIQLANRYGQYVFLDMHQDLFSCQFSDGAPAWATLTGEHAYSKTDLWSDAYLFDPAVQTAFDNFWNNSPAPDGIGIQDHFVQAWKYTAQKLSNEPNLIGYDIMNEPFIGTDVQHIIDAMFTAYAELIAKQTGQMLGMEELLNVWMDPEKKLEALQLLESPEAFSQVMKATEPAQAHFERNILSPFFSKVGAAIREVDPHRILFLETNYFSNLGVASAISPILDKDGVRDKQQAYAPHGYDLVTDSEFVHAASNNRVDFIFDQHDLSNNRLKMPMLIGEWGAYGESDQAEEAAIHVQRNFERLLCSDAYWCYLYPDMDRYSSFKGVCRGYPMAASGTITQYSYDHSNANFVMEWDEDTSIDEATIIYLPNLEATKSATIEITPPNSQYTWEPLDGTDAGFLRIEVAGGGNRVVRISEN